MSSHFLLPYHFTFCGVYLLKIMLIHLLIPVAVINFSPGLLLTVSLHFTQKAFSDSDNVIRNKRSDDYIPCEFGWYYFREKCYKVGGRRQSERLHWDRALERCRSYGGDLVSIQSQEEQDFIISFLLMDVKASTWIGLSDREKESDYRWTDGSVFNYTNWDEMSPSKVDYLGTREQCIQMLIIPSIEFIGKWNDRQCDFSGAYICQMKANPRKRSPNPMRCSSEEGGGWKYESSCYHVVTDMTSWQDAERYCRSIYNGHLVTVLDILVDLFLDHILDDKKNELWIGIKMKMRHVMETGAASFRVDFGTKKEADESTATEMDIRLVSYDGFKKEQLNFVEGTCAARKKRKEWLTVPCAKKLSFICQVSKETPPVLKLPARVSHCPKELDDWRDLGGDYCYYFETGKSVNFYEAIFDCKRRGGDLVSMHSKEESAVLHQFVKYIRRDGGYYIGLIRLLAQEEEFGWTDGSAMNFENWRQNEPNDEADKCVEAVAFQGFVWNDNSCLEKKGYICSVKKISPNSNFEEEDGCRSFCIDQLSHLYEMVYQSPDAKRCKTRCQT